MTLDELAERAYEQSLQKIETDGKRQSLRYEREAFFALDPITMEGSVRKINADERSGDGNEYGFMVGFTVWNPKLREAQNAQFDALTQTLLQSEALKKGMLRVELKREYLLESIAKEALNLAADKRRLAEEAYVIAVKKFQAGRISQMERVRFETERDVAAKEVREWELVVQKHQDALREQAMTEEEIVIDDLSFGFVNDADTQTMIAEAPVLKTFSALSEELERSIETVRRSTAESANIGVGMTQEPTQNSVDLRLTIPLSLGSKNEKKMAALMAQKSALIHQKNASEEKLRMMTEHTFLRLNRIRHSIEESSSAEQRYEALYKMAKKGFEGGVIGLFEYLETKNRFYSAKLQTLQLKRDYVEAVAGMEEKMGRTWE